MGYSILAQECLGSDRINLYFFNLYALDQQLQLESGATRNQLEAARDGHILATAELIGRYSR